MPDRKRYSQRSLFSAYPSLHLLRWMAILGILGASIWFIAQKVYSEYAIISTSCVKVDIFKLLISWVCVTISTLLGAWEWTLLVKALGGYLNPVTGMRVHLISVLIKYVPGYIWPYFGKAYLAARFGVPYNIAILSIAGELVVVYLSGILILLLSLLLNGLIGKIAESPGAEVVLAAGCSIVTFAILDERFGELLKFVKTIRWKGVVFVTAAVALTWCLLGFGFYMLDASIEPPTDNPGRLLAGLIAALLGGQLALFVPMGIGVREAILTAFLDKPSWLVILMAVIFRLEMLLGEVVSTLLVVAWSAVRSRNNSKG